MYICTMVSGELIVSRYVAESITTDAGRFGHIGLCQLRTVLYTKYCIIIAMHEHNTINMIEMTVGCTVPV